MKKICLLLLPFIGMFDLLVAQKEIRNNNIPLQIKPAPVDSPPPTVFIGSDYRKMTVDMCMLKAMEAMIYQQHFIEARVNGSDTWGYNEKSFVLVHAVVIDDRVEIFVVAFSTLSQEAERLRNAIRVHVFDGAYNPNMPKDYKDNHGRKQPPFFIRWSHLQMVGELTGTENWFHSCAISAMSSNHLKETHTGNQIIFGKDETGSVVVIGVGLQKVTFNGVVPVTQNITPVIVIASSAYVEIAGKLKDKVKSSMDCATL